MDLSDALDGDWPTGGNQSRGGMFPGPAPSQPGWPGPGSGGPAPSQPVWPGPGSGGPAPSQPVWPGPGSGGPAPSQPVWPGPGSGGPAPSQPVWPGPGSGGPAPSQPVWPGPGSGGPAPSWPAQPSQPGGPPPSWPAQPSQPGGPPPSWPAQPGGRQQSLAVPYNHTLPSGVHNNLMIIINGVVNPNPNMFTVDICAGETIAFHMNPRFNDRGQKTIVRNSCIRKKWGAEERQIGHFPFIPGQPFEIKILCTSREFKVAVNGSHLLEFKHRFQELNSITSFGIYNDVTLTGVRTETLP